MTPVTPGRVLTLDERAFIERLVAEHSGKPGMLLSILESIQEQQRQKYLPIEYLEYVSERTGIAPSDIYSVATFYALFNLKPQGVHSVCICRGTACHTRGSQQLLEGARLKVGLRDSEQDDNSADRLAATTSDGEFTVRTVACFGQCALAPVAEVDHQILSHVNERTLAHEIDALRASSRR